MRKPVVVYTDVPWILGEEGCVDPSRATIERQVFDDDCDLRFTPAEGGRHLIDGPQFLEALGGADAMVIYRCAIRDEILDAAGHALKVVARQGVGFDNLAPELLESRGIIGFNIPDYCVDEVATHTLALLLALERGVVPQYLSLTQGKFNIYAGGVPRRLRKCTAGIIGLGRIGQAVSVRLKAFYGRVIAFDPYVAEDMMDAYGVAKVDFDTLLASADVLLLHCLLNDETTGMMNARAFAKMKPGALLVNTARGALVDSRSLWQALSKRQIAGAAIDVFSPEDPQKDEWYSRVLKMTNVAVSCHRAFLSAESQVSQRRRTAEGILEVLKYGRPPAVGHLTLGLKCRNERDASLLRT